MERIWTDYLPCYRLPRGLTGCFGCLAALLVGGALLIFLGLPLLLGHLNALDPEPILDVALGESATVGEVTLTVIGLEDNMGVRLRTSLDDAERTVLAGRCILRAGCVASGLCTAGVVGRASH